MREHSAYEISEQLIVSETLTMDPLPIPVQTFVNGLRLNPTQTVTWSLQRTAYFMLTLQFASETQYKNYASNPLNMGKNDQFWFSFIDNGISNQFTH